MNDELLALAEREVLGWPGVSKELTGAVGAGADLGVTGDSLKGLTAGRSDIFTTPA